MIARGTTFAVLLAVVPRAAAEPTGPCEADGCIADPAVRPWVLRDPCIDKTDVVGKRECSDFGSWAAPALAPHMLFGVGLGWRRVARPRTVDVARATTPDVGVDDDIAVSSLRIAAASHWLYVGLELELGDVLAREYAYGGFLQSGAVVGATLPFGRFDAGAELAIAGRELKQTIGTGDSASEISHLGLAAELRVHAELWLSPWIAVGGELGTGLIDRSEWVGAITAAFHTRAYGGTRDVTDR